MAGPNSCSNSGPGHSDSNRMQMTLYDPLARALLELDALDSEIQAEFGDGPLHCGSIMKRHGFHRDGRLRLSCRQCGATKICGEAPISVKRLRIMRAMELLRMPGITIREAARIAGCSINTVLPLARSIDLPACPCGQPSGHRGWCRFRFGKSSLRQQFMRHWHVPA
jgi:hypothetical protein